MQYLFWPGLRRSAHTEVMYRHGDRDRSATKSWIYLCLVYVVSTVVGPIVLFLSSFCAWLFRGCLPGHGAGIEWLGRKKKCIVSYIYLKFEWP